MKRAIPLLLAALLVVAAVPTPVAADHDDGLGGLFDAEGGEDQGLVPDAYEGYVAGVIASFTSSPADNTASESAQQVTTYFNNRSQAFTDYANARTDATTDANVLELSVTVDGKTATRYVVADVNGSNYTNVSVVKQTDRTVDENCTLQGDAARNAPQELEHFYTEFVEPGKDITTAYLAKKKGRYRDDVACSFLGGGT